MMVINNNKILSTVSRHIHYSTATVLRSTIKKIFKGIFEVTKQYEYQGMRVTTVLVDKQFEGLALQLTGVILNIVSRDEHIPEIERLIQTIKVRCQFFPLEHCHSRRYHIGCVSI